MSDEMKKSTFEIGMASIGVAFSRDMTDMIMRTYWKALSDLKAEELERGFNLAVKLDKFWPPPSRIRELGEAPKRRKIYE